MLGDGERAALQFSGGKDSTALIYLARPCLDRITVYFGDTGAVFPHVRQHVEETCRRLGARLKIVTPEQSIDDYHAAAGLPSDIVPIEAMAEMQPLLAERRPQLIQSYLRCCAAMLWAPMEKAMRRDGHKIVLRGSKRCDRRVGVGPVHSEHGVEYRSPLWEWSDERVMAYLAAEDARLPAHYSAVPDSLDCWLCTAHLAHHGEAKLRWMREHHPELWRGTRARLRRLEAALATERACVSAAFGVAQEG